MIYDEYDNNYNKFQLSCKSKNTPPIDDISIPKYINRKTNNDVVTDIKYGLNNCIESEDFYNNEEFDKHQKYNPYYDYLLKNGLIRENYKTSVSTQYINVDSSYRKKIKTIKVSEEISLNTNPLIYDSEITSFGIINSIQNLLTIKVYDDHDFKIGDKINLSGLEYTTSTILSKYTENNTTYNSIVFTQDSRSVIFITNFSNTLLESFDPNFQVGLGIDATKLQLYDTSDMFVDLSGFDISSSGNPFVSNIPINFLNGKHQVYFSNPNFTIQNGKKVYSSNDVINIPNSNNVVEQITGFYILLPYPYISDETNNVMKITMSFDYVGGIPIKYINNVHIVSSVTRDSISVKINKTPYFKNSSGLQQEFGGDTIKIGKINEMSFEEENNNYTIDLPKTISNVSLIRLSNAIFPFSAYAFVNSETTINTKLYWRNRDDHDFIYNIQIPSGNYSNETLCSLIEDSVYNVEKKYVSSCDYSTKYIKNHIWNVSIDEDTNTTLIKSYLRAFLRKPINKITQMKLNNEIVYELNVYQKNHRLNVGDKIIFNNFLNSHGIPSTSLNTTHVVSSIVSCDIYSIIIKNINLLSDTSETGGGDACMVDIPTQFQLFFNYSDTMGNQLGFRNVGNEDSITNFKYEISNNDEYINENIIIDNNIKYILDEFNNKYLLKGNNVKLQNDSYILMKIDQLNNMYNSSNNDVKHFFAKIDKKQITDNQLVINPPIDLNTLKISLYDNNGNLYDFNGFEHSFILEITTIHNIPLQTNIITTTSQF